MLTARGWVDHGLLCMWEGCRKPSREVHHIHPRSKGGDDAEDNKIALCKSHHRNRKIHREWRIRFTELITFKFFAVSHQARKPDDYFPNHETVSNQPNEIVLPPQDIPSPSPKIYCEEYRGEPLQPVHDRKNGTHRKRCYGKRKCGEIECRILFIRKHHAQKYCSDECSKKSNSWRL